MFIDELFTFSIDLAPPNGCKHVFFKYKQVYIEFKLVVVFGVVLFGLYKDYIELA